MSNLDNAFLLERDVLGRNWHALPCGCHLRVHCRFMDLLHLAYVNHRLHCDEHKNNNFFGRWGGAPKTWASWYRTVNGLLYPVIQQEFQERWDRYIDGDGFWLRGHPSDAWVLSDGSTHKVFRTGTTEEYDGEH